MLSMDQGIELMSRKRATQLLPTASRGDISGGKLESGSGDSRSSSGSTKMRLPNPGGEGSIY